MGLRLLPGLLVGAMTGIALSAYQYWGPLDYLGLRPALPLFGVNFVVGMAAGLLLAAGFRVRGLTRKLVVLVGSVALTAGWGYWNMRRDFDVVVLVSDAVRADHVSVYGYHRETTPNWDEVARGQEGVRFSTAISQGTWTFVGGPALIAGLYQTQTGMQGFEYVLPEKVDTLAEVLSRSGYTTYAAMSNPHLSQDRGFSQGFSSFTDTASWDRSPSAAVIAWDFARWYGEKRPHRLFAFLFFVDTHAPYRGLLKDVFAFRPEYKVVNRVWLNRVMRDYQAADREDLIALYDAALLRVDWACGEVFDALRRARTLDNTMIVMTSDHGEELWDHGRTGHRREPYDSVVHIPLIIQFPSPVRFPRIRPVAHVCQHPAAQVDVMPTILRFVGAPVPSVVMGENLLPYVFGRKPADRDRGLLAEMVDAKRSHRAWRKGSYEVIITERGSDAGVELFNLDSDPQEKANLATKRRDLLASLKKEMEQELARARAHTVRAETKDLSPQEMRNLRALGYL